MNGCCLAVAIKPLLSFLDVFSPAHGGSGYLIELRVQLVFMVETGEAPSLPNRPAEVSKSRLPNRMVADCLAMVLSSYCLGSNEQSLFRGNGTADSTGFACNDGCRRLWVNHVEHSLDENR